MFQSNCEWFCCQSFSATERILIKARQAVDVKKEDGFAALHLAALNGHLKVANTLIMLVSIYMYRVYVYTLRSFRIYKIFINVDLKILRNTCNFRWKRLDVKAKVEVYSLVSMLQHSHATSHLWLPGHRVCPCKCQLNSVGSIQARAHGCSLPVIHGYSCTTSWVPIYTPGSREAFKIKHFA